MGKGNGKTDAHLDLRSEDLRGEDLDHELPAGDDDEAASGAAASKPVETGVVSETEKLKAERDALLDRLARLQAEFDNARKRAVREQQEFREFAAADAIKALLPPLDSFERALRAGGDSGELRNGIELIYRQFQDALQKIGVQPIAATGQAFDPRIHEAVEMVETSEVPDHYVLDELQRGYKYKGRLLRPAMVRVARNSRG
ncbi:MAG: nucleotide exchange factor GrpE [Terriglobales bacterium]|jgi:molecular chaperone GrpE